uniref:SET domain-containing protein n=1 Tax=Trypanosoma congolense (strain IL3000) TaxID=1068625 RepID=G0UN66_TRYCI|nr:conserved hypothetical protein [Trypanosoma congolense IL3000]
MAYVGYAVGRVSFFTRRSVAPPLAPTLNKALAPSHAQSSAHLSSDDIGASMHQLFAIGAYEQAASLSTATIVGGMGTSQHVPYGTTERDSLPSASAPYFRGFLQGTALSCIKVGRSPIHSRGLFTTEALPRGTRVLVAPQRTYMDAAQLLILLADTHKQLPDTLHYTHPTGSLMELVTQPLPHHLMNHSCEPNCCCGLSKEFWPSGKTASSSCEIEEIMNRIENFPHFEDANSFFTTRDVPAGSELTISYSHRVAPVFYGENPSARYFSVCHCGSPNCRHFVYKPTDEALRYLGKNAGSSVNKKKLLSSFISRGVTATPAAGNVCSFQESTMRNIEELLSLGYDDETVILGLLPSRVPLIKYMSTHLLDSCRTATKRDILVCYRHVFKLLNEAAPLD